VVVGFGENAQDQPALLRHAQARIPELALETGHALIDSRHPTAIAMLRGVCKKSLLQIQERFLQIIVRSVDRCNWFAIA
jgi:hypothetical protein